jgi:hypothetical protein
MRRILALAALLASSLALPAAPALAQDDTASCMAQMQAAVRPLLEQAGQFSPEGVRGQGFAPLTRPFAPPYYGSRFGPYPTAPWLPAPTAAYNTSAQLTAFSGLPQPGAIGFPPNVGLGGVAGVGGVGVGGVGVGLGGVGGVGVGLGGLPGVGVGLGGLPGLGGVGAGLGGFPGGGGLNSQQIGQFLLAGGQLNLTNPAALTPQQSQLLLALANLQQTEQARSQQQSLLQQQQGLYLNSLYQLSASYQVTALDWAEAYSTLAQAWMSYYRDLCSGRGGDSAMSAPPPSPVGSPTQNVPGFPTR